MKFMKYFDQFIKIYESENNFNAQLLEVKISVKDVKNDKASVDYAIFYEGKEFAKASTFMTKTQNYYEIVGGVKLDNPIYPLKGKLNVHMSVNDARNGAKLVAKIGQNDPSKTGLFNVELNLVIRKEPDPFLLKINGLFKPNEVILDESKKSDVDKELTRLELYFREHKDSILKDESKLVFKLIGGASQIATTYPGGNQKLSQDRANFFKKYMLDYFKASNVPGLIDLINRKLQVELVIGQTPYIDIKTKYAGKTDPASINAANKDKAINDANKAKYDAEQFVSLELKTIL